MSRKGGVDRSECGLGCLIQKQQIQRVIQKKNPQLQTGRGQAIGQTEKRGRIREQSQHQENKHGITVWYRQRTNQPSPKRPCIITPPPVVSS